MKVIGSVIARLGSKRLSHKNLLPFKGEPLVGIGIKKLQAAKLVDEVIVSTESELIARVAYDYGATVLQWPIELAEDNIPSIPVFQHIMSVYPGDVHVNYNINFPLCDPAVIDRAIELALEKGESLSDPYAVWAQTAHTLKTYGNPWEITAFKFTDDRAGKIDIHTHDDLLATYRIAQGDIPNWSKNYYTEEELLSKLAHNNNLQSAILN